LRQIDQPPPDDAMDRGRRAALNDVHHRSALFLVEEGSLARFLPIQQTVRAMAVEPQHPIPNHLKPNTADPRRIPARATVVNLGK
jgi:hypothetical protein